MREAGHGYRAVNRAGYVGGILDKLAGHTTLLSDSCLNRAQKTVALDCNSILGSQHLLCRLCGVVAGSEQCHIFDDVGGLGHVRNRVGMAC